MSKYLFTAKWCTTCKALKGMVDIDKLGCEIIDVDSLEGIMLAREHEVDMLPCFINGDKRWDGLKNHTKEELEEFFK